MRQRGARHGLCIGIGTFRDPQREPEIDALSDLDFARARAARIGEVLSELGYTCVTDDETSLSSGEALGERVLAEIGKRAADDVQVVHVVSHGLLAPSGMYLVGADGKHARGSDVADWIKYHEDFRDECRPVTLFLVDACHAGAAARLSWLPAAGSDTRAWVIAATPGDQEAYDGVFSRAAAEVLSEIARDQLDLYPSEYVRFGDLVELIRGRVALLGDRRQYVTSTPVDGAPEPPFIVNPRRSTDSALAQAKQGLDPVARPFLDLDQSLDAGHFADRAGGRLLGMGSMAAKVQGCFTGRTEELAQATRWITDGPGSLRLVTGGAGSGKSAVLGILVCSAHPRLREATRRLWNTVPSHAVPPVTQNLAAVHLRERDIGGTVKGLAAQLGIPLPDGNGENIDQWIVGEVARLPDPPLIIMDALDEAIDQKMIMELLLLPLAQTLRADGLPACRLLVGTRPWRQFRPLRELADEQGGLVDLDRVPKGRLQSELAAYVTDLLSLAPYELPVRRQLARGVAKALTGARHRGGEFLAASLFSNWLLHTHPTGVTEEKAVALTSQVPQSVPELLDLDLAISPHRAGTASSDEVGRWSKAVLRAVAYSRGLGMPATVIRRLAPLILPGDDVSGEISPALLRKVLERVRFYLRSSPEVDGTTLYRIFHQGLVDHLRVPDSALGGLYDRLMERTAMGPDGQRYVAAAEPYVARHAVEHAVDAGRLDELVHVDSEALRTLFNAVQTGPGRIAAAIWRQSDTDPHASGSVSQVSPVEVRRDLLSLDAIRFGADEVAARLTSVPGLRPPLWRPLWSTNGQLDSPEQRAVLTAENGVTAVACTTLNGSPVAVSAENNGDIRVWDLVRGIQIGSPTRRRNHVARKLVCTTLEGRPIAVTADAHNQVSVWDLADKTPLDLGSRRMRKLKNLVTSAPTIVNASRTDDALTSDSSPSDAKADGVYVWDPVARAPLGHALMGSLSPYAEVACLERDGRRIAVTGGIDVRVWDLADGRPIGPPLIGHRQRISSVACTTVAGRSVAVTGSSDGTVRVWDLTDITGNRSAPITHTDWVQAVSCARIDNRVVAVTGGYDKTVRMWDLSNRRLTDLAMQGHDRAVRAVRCVTLDGRPTAVTAGLDKTVRLWDLRTSKPVGKPLIGHGDYVWSIDCITLHQRVVAVTCSSDATVRRWDLHTQKPLGQPLTGHRGTVWSVACTMVNGRPLAVTGGDDATVQLWNLRSGRPRKRPLGQHDSPVWSVACTTLKDRPVAVTAGNDAIRIWDITSGTPVGAPMIGHEGRLRAVTCATLDGRPIAVSGGDDKTLRTWDLTTGQEQDRFNLPAAVCALGFAPEGGLVLGFGWQVAGLHHDPDGGKQWTRRP